MVFWRKISAEKRVKACFLKENTTHFEATHFEADNRAFFKTPFLKHGQLI